MDVMTGIPIRNIGFAAWYDPDAWMEYMKGPKWKLAVQKENKNVSDFLAKPEVKLRLPYFTALADKGYNSNKNTFCFRSGPVSIQPNGMFQRWRWSSEPNKIYFSKDLFADKRGVWWLREIGNGAELYQLEYWTSPSATKPSWFIKPVGQEIAIQGSRCYYLGIYNKLWFNEVWSCDAATGEDKVLMYKETNPEINLDIVRGPSHKVYLTQENAQNVTWYEIKNDKIIPLTKEPSLAWKGFHTKRNKGAQTLFEGSKEILRIPAGIIQIDPWAMHLNEESACVLVEQPNIQPIYHTIQNKTLIKQPSPPSGLKLDEGIAKDGTRFVVAYKDTITKPEKILITGYGAYGLPTSAGYARYRWNPLLESNWAIAYTFLPGGGDDKVEYAKRGQRVGRTQTISAFLSCVEKIKTTYKIPSSKTVIYGRSAGGLLMGGSLKARPDGDLFGGIYTEVPYVDELRTTTNPRLPLTRLEYKEFGNPTESLEDFLSVGLLSPADAATTLKTPKVFVYAKTAENDTQVYAYEPLKWITRLRKASPVGKPKLLKIDFNSGHFTSPESAVETIAIDSAILDTLTD